jgi:hypothetical protein
MPRTFINKPEDMSWLFSTHLKALPPLAGKSLALCRSAIITGNEDCPDEIELHWAHNPLVYEMAAAHFVRGEDGELHVKE